jgi:hypothetical protein
MIALSQHGDSQPRNTGAMGQPLRALKVFAPALEQSQRK